MALQNPETIFVQKLYQFNKSNETQETTTKKRSGYKRVKTTMENNHSLLGYSHYLFKKKKKRKKEK